MDNNFDIVSGQRIGDYRITERIGVGGMGVVYRARELTTDRMVALKVLGAAFDDDEAIARSRREAEAIARLDHPRIPKIHHVGQDHRVRYLVMDAIDGISLGRLIAYLSVLEKPTADLDAIVATLPDARAEPPVVRVDDPTITHRACAETSIAGSGAAGSTPLSMAARSLIRSPSYQERCCRLVLDVAQALEHAHRRGVIHRDVKPENILLDRAGRAHLIDFGLARLADGSRMTATAALLGTPRYMSPEQVSAHLSIDHRSDIYSLGLVLYELLGLQRPIESDSHIEVLQQVVTKALVPITWRNRAVPRDLEAVVHKATAKDPDERYPTAEAFADDLDRFLDGGPVDAPTYRYRLDTDELRARRPRSIPFASVAMLVIVVGNLTNMIWVASIDADKSPWALILLALLGLAQLLIAIDLQSGRRRARWGTIGSLGIMLVIIWPPLLRFGNLSRFPSDPLTVAFLTYVIFITALSAMTTASLLSRRTDAWFALAERIRAMHPLREAEQRS